MYTGASTDSLQEGLIFIGEGATNDLLSYPDIEVLICLATVDRVNRAIEAYMKQA